MEQLLPLSGWRGIESGRPGSPFPGRVTIGKLNRPRFAGE